MGDDNKEQKFLRDTAVIGIGNILSKGIVFLLIPIHTAMLTPAEYGASELIYNFVNLCLLIFSCSIADAGVRFALDASFSKAAVFSITIFLPVISSLFLVMAASVTGSFLEVAYLDYILMLYMLFALRESITQFFRGIGQLKTFSWLNILFAVSLLICNVIFLMCLDLKVIGYVYSFVTASIGVIAIGFYKLSKMYGLRFPDKKLMGQMLQYGIPLSFNAISAWVTSVSGRYFLAYFCSVAASGIYSAAYKFMMIIVVLVDVFQKSWQISAVQSYMDSDRNTFFSAVYKKFVLMAAFFSFVLLLILVPLAPFALSKTFSEAIQYIPFMVVLGFLVTLPSFWGVIYLVVKDTRGVFLSTVIGAAVSLVMFIVLIPAYEIGGCIMASCLGYLSIIAYRIIDCRKYLKVDNFAAETIILLFLLIVVACLINYNIYFAALLNVIIIIMFVKKYRYVFISK
jgi:O-antigen/teichoic acid export membrane protein